MTEMTEHARLSSFPPQGLCTWYSLPGFFPRLFKWLAPALPPHHHPEVPACTAHLKHLLVDPLSQHQPCGQYCTSP